MAFAALLSTNSISARSLTDECIVLFAGRRHNINALAVVDHVAYVDLPTEGSSPIWQENLSRCAVEGGRL